VQRKGKPLTFEQAKQKALRYCAYQERSHQEVKNKLYDLGLYTSQVDELLVYLITEGFLNKNATPNFLRAASFASNNGGV
jgi:regulatory protein